MKKKNKLQELTDKFLDDTKSLLDTHKDSGVIVIAIDGDYSDEQAALFGGSFGDRTALIFGITHLMEEKENFRELLEESVGFYKFNENPTKLIKGLKEITDMLEESMTKVKNTKRVTAEDTAEEIKN